jgi:thiamine-phosphate pyrophosphorylase
MLRYYITDRQSCGGNVLPFVAAAVADGVDYIQVREKDLPTRALVELVRQAVRLTERTQTKVLVNERADVAIAAGAHGVHLPGDSPPPAAYKPLFEGKSVAVSCHSAAEVQKAAAEGADFVVFGPVFESPGKGGSVGLEALAEACRATSIPVLALGGITLTNKESCMRAGAAGIAGIRLFQVPGE